MGVPQDSVCYAAQKTVLILLILPSCDDTTMSITYYLDYELFRPLWIFLCLLLDQIPVCGLRTFCDLSGFPLPTTWSDPRLRYSPILCAPVCTISIHPGTYWPDPRLHHHHHRHHHHHDHLRRQPTQPMPKNLLKLFFSDSDYSFWPPGYF